MKVMEEYNPIIAFIVEDIVRRIDRGASLADAMQQTRQWTERAGVKWEG